MPPFVAAVALVVVVAEELVLVPIPPVKAVEAPPVRLTPAVTMSSWSVVRVTGSPALAATCQAEHRHAHEC